MYLYYKCESRDGEDHYACLRFRVIACQAVRQLQRRTNSISIGGWIRPTTEKPMNLDKSKKRIAKRSKMGFQGYPKISISYHGKTIQHADEVVVEFLLEEGAEIQTEKFTSKTDAREDEVIQSALVKMIERSEAKTVVQQDGVFAPTI